MRGQMSGRAGVPPEKIRVIAEEVGRGVRRALNIYPKLRAPARCEAARPAVKWSARAPEDMHRAARIVTRAAARWRSTLRPHPRHALRVGATWRLSRIHPGSFVNTVNLVNVASGVYDVQAVHVQAKPR